MHRSRAHALGGRGAVVWTTREKGKRLGPELSRRTNAETLRSVIIRGDQSAFFCLLWACRTTDAALGVLTGPNSPPGEPPRPLRGCRPPPDLSRPGAGRLMLLRWLLVGDGVLLRFSGIVTGLMIDGNALRSGGSKGSNLAWQQ